MNDGVIVVKMTRPMVSALLIALRQVDIERYPPSLRTELMSAAVQLEAWLRNSLPADAGGIAP